MTQLCLIIIQFTDILPSLNQVVNQSLVFLSVPDDVLCHTLDLLLSVPIRLLSTRCYNIADIFLCFLPLCEDKETIMEKCAFQTTWGF